MRDFCFYLFSFFLSNVVALLFVSQGGAPLARSRLTCAVLHFFGVRARARKREPKPPLAADELLLVRAKASHGKNVK